MYLFLRLQVLCNLCPDKFDGSYSLSLRFPEMANQIPCKANSKFLGWNEEGGVQRPSPWAIK